MSEIKNIRDQFISKLENDLSIDQINEIKTDLFGKNGLISSTSLSSIAKFIIYYSFIPSLLLRYT